MHMLRFTMFLHLLILTSLFWSHCSAGDSFYDFKLSYVTASPLGVRQQIIAVNGEFPGPLVNVTTNDIVVVNVWNNLDEPLLLTWPGIQMRRNSWEDGVRGTNCPIPPRHNFTYRFQVKDQIGSFFYFPSLNFQRASGGVGPFIINNRDVIPIPFSKPDGEIHLMIGDWYSRNHKALREMLDCGKGLDMPDGVLINGKGPYQYNNTVVPNGIEYETIHVNHGKTYRVRVHNVGISTSLNFRIQNHTLLLVETDGYYTMPQRYSSFDIHVGQSYSFLVTMNKKTTSDFYIVASARFVNESEWSRVKGVAVLKYSKSNGPASGPLPEPPSDVYHPWCAMNQPRSIRQNTSSSGPRPNPQGSFHYGSINITHTYILRSLPPMTINGTRRATFNGVSFVNPRTPIRLTDLKRKGGDSKLDFPDKPLEGPPRMDTSIINATYKGFIEIILQNNDTQMQSFHADGYSFFVVGMDFGNWTESKRYSYNRWDAIARSTIEVYPGAWTAVLISLDNCGVWNLRVENLDRWYLGQETYMRIINPEENGKTEFPPPDNVLYCGALQSLQPAEQNAASATKKHVSSATAVFKGPSEHLLSGLLVALTALISTLF